MKIKDWKLGVEILKQKPQIRVSDLAEQLECEYPVAVEVINSYCQIYKVKRDKAKKEHRTGIEYQISKIYRTKSKHNPLREKTENGHPTQG